jgi:hypothetical protein
VADASLQSHEEIRLNNALWVAAILALCLGGYCFLRFRLQRRVEAEWEERHPRSAFRYCGRTLAFYEASHGNQVEFLDVDGYCYLWYPGNSDIVVGRWRSDGLSIYFRYGINTFNPVTGIVGGQWEPCPIEAWTTSIVEDIVGDALQLKNPYVLGRHPRMRSIRELSSFGGE